MFRIIFGTIFCFSFLNLAIRTNLTKLAAMIFPSLYKFTVTFISPLPRKVGIFYQSIQSLKCTHGFDIVNKLKNIDIVFLCLCGQLHVQTQVVIEERNYTL